jgi:hypothetical protein
MAAPRAASPKMAVWRLRRSLLNTVLMYGGGVGWQTHLGRSRAAGSTRTWHVIVFGLTWASGAWGNGLVVCW